jgi:hypothetical protein
MLGTQGKSRPKAAYKILAPAFFASSAIGHVLA